VTWGSGSSNQVVGGSAALSTLTLNIAAGTTNAYAGILGGGRAYENNLALVLKGGGFLFLSGLNSYTGTTHCSGRHIGGNQLAGGRANR
jgi:autotransporter-associated beta strand protein